MIHFEFFKNDVFTFVDMCLFEWVTLHMYMHMKTEEGIRYSFLSLSDYSEVESLSEPWLTMFSTMQEDSKSHWFSYVHLY